MGPKVTESCEYKSGLGCLAAGKLPLSTQQQMSTCFKSGKDKAPKGEGCTQSLTLLHSERPKLYTILAFLSAIR